VLVRAGQRVKRGQIIANVGSTGLSTGPHVHYEIHVNGKVVDPLTYVLPAGVIPD
jgi:murein DD-endopeptidase